MGRRRLHRAWFVVLVGLALLTKEANAVETPADLMVGVWRSIGYGEVLVVEGNRFRIYTETASSLIERHSGTRNLNILTFETEKGTAVLVLEAGTLHLWRNEFTFGRQYRRANIRIRPTQPTKDPFLNLQVAWEAFNENYAFFEARGVKWRDQYDKARARIKAGMSEEELFSVISDMLASLGDDGHVSLRWPGKQSFSGARVKPHPMRAHVDQWREMVRRKYLNNAAERMANEKIVTGRLPDGTLYVELFRVAGFSETGTADKEIAAFNEALDRMFGRLKPGEPLVLDLRFNAGGYDDYSLLIAGRFTREPAVAFLKQPRIQGSNTFGPLHVRHVFPSTGPQALGPIILLTSGMTYSGAEILTMATMKFANITRVGEPTAGALSDVLPFKLPNGWEIGLSNERYFASDGVVYEDRGVPPHVPASLTKESLDRNIDPVLETAMKLISQKTDTIVPRQ